MDTFTDSFVSPICVICMLHVEIPGGALTKIPNPKAIDFVNVETS